MLQFNSHILCSTWCKCKALIKLTCILSFSSEKESRELKREAGMSHILIFIASISRSSMLVTHLTTWRSSEVEQRVKWERCLSVLDIHSKVMMMNVIWMDNLFPLLPYPPLSLPTGSLFSKFTSYFSFFFIFFSSPSCSPKEKDPCMDGCLWVTWLIFV